MPFWAGPMLRIVILVVVALAVGVLVDDAAGWALLAAGLAAGYAYHLIQVGRLTRWLDRTRWENAVEVPESSGEWGMSAGFFSSGAVLGSASPPILPGRPTRPATDTPARPPGPPGPDAPGTILTM